jgi:hypothetical protein
MLDQPYQLAANIDDIMSYNDHYNHKHNSIREDSEFSQILAEVSMFKSDLIERAIARNSSPQYSPSSYVSPQPEKKNRFNLFSKLRRTKSRKF